MSTWYGVFAPGTPAAVVTTVNAEINKLLATADMKAAIQAQGAEPEAMSPAQLGTVLKKKEYTQWKGIVEASGAKIGNPLGFAFPEGDAPGGLAKPVRRVHWFDRLLYGGRSVRDIQ